MEDGSRMLGLVDLPWIRYWNNNGKHGEGPLEEVVEKTCVPTQALLRMLRGWRTNPVCGWYFQPETEWPQNDGYEVGVAFDGRRVPRCFHNGSPGRISRPLVLSEKAAALENAMNGDVADLMHLTNTPEYCGVSQVDDSTTQPITLASLSKALHDIYPHYPNHPIIDCAIAERLSEPTNRCLDAESTRRAAELDVIENLDAYQRFMTYLNLFIRCWVAFGVAPDEPFHLSTFVHRASLAGIEFKSTLAEESFKAIDRFGTGAVMLPDICYWFATNKDIRHQ
ncbi:hypothetical protein DIPPA_03456 [Diplonema papillatum]|nr:hypothetical protein DIPPA_03456 [Diplonema papillatum]